MFRIKLLILLLISFTISSCNGVSKTGKVKLSVGYISGEYDGLVLSNHLKSYLNSFGMLDERSRFEVQAKISHSQNLFITNIDNTSDRERVISSIKIDIFDKRMSCYSRSYVNSTDQFYVLASSDKFISNKTAVEEIKNKNTEYLVKKFINYIDKDTLTCKAIKR